MELQYIFTFQLNITKNYKHALSSMPVLATSVLWKLMQCFGFLAAIIVPRSR
jgi:hypothetical protein